MGTKGGDSERDIICMSNNNNRKIIVLTAYLDVTDDDLLTLADGQVL